MSPLWPAPIAPYAVTVERMKGVLLASIRKRSADRRDRGHRLRLTLCSWEQGAAANALLELECPARSLFGVAPLDEGGPVPRTALQLALSAAYLQGDDGRLSQKIGGGTDGSSLQDPRQDARAEKLNVQVRRLTGPPRELRYSSV